MKPNEVSEVLSRHTLSIEGAKAIAAAAASKARAEEWRVVIAILDAGGHLLYLERFDGAQLGSIIVAQEKAKTALFFKRPSKALEDAVLGGKMHMMALLGATPIEGGLPLIHRGEVVGAIGVSGVLSSQDGEIASVGAPVLLNFGAKVTA